MGDTPQESGRPGFGDDVIRHNLRALTSRAFWDVAVCESLGGNAGRSCYAVNFRMDDDGRIFYIGNDPQPRGTHAGIRIYVPLGLRNRSRIREMVIEIYGSVRGEQRQMLEQVVWLWNLFQRGEDREVLDRFLDGRMALAELEEVLEARYPGRR